MTLEQIGVLDDIRERLRRLLGAIAPSDYDKHLRAVGDILDEVRSHAACDPDEAIPQGLVEPRDHVG